MINRYFRMGNSTSEAVKAAAEGATNGGSKRNSATRNGSSSASGGNTSTAAASAAASSQTLETLRGECIELGIDFPSNATKEELLELIAVARNKKRPSLWKIATDSYEELVHAIIRPPRAQYTLAALRHPVFHVDGVLYERVDFELVNDRGLKLQCSWWRPSEGKGPNARPPQPKPVCVYLHGNSSCRAEATDQLAAVLGSGISMLAFDFAGSGLSDGEYVSLGYYEREDLQTVVNYLRASGRVSTIALWGRSMGAVTALLFVDRDPSISCLICDSPFSSLKTLAKELVESAQLNVPRFAVGLGLRMVRSSVKSRAGFDINALEPIANVNKCFVPCLFAAADDDNFIRPKHAEELHAAYAGDKNIVRFSGNHNTRRDEFFVDSAIIFMHNSMIHDGTTVMHSGEHQAADLGASAYSMPAPLAHPSGQSHLVNPSSAAFHSATTASSSSSAHHHRDVPEPVSPRRIFERDNTAEEDEEEQMLRYALELSLKEQSQAATVSKPLE